MRTIQLRLKLTLCSRRIEQLTTRRSNRKLEKTFLDNPPFAAFLSLRRSPLVETQSERLLRLSNAIHLSPSPILHINVVLSFVLAHCSERFCLRIQSLREIPICFLYSRSLCARELLAKMM